MLTIDDREPAEVRLPLQRRLGPDQVKVERMRVGDYRIEVGEGVVLVERKATGDLLSSFVKKEEGTEVTETRLRRQLRECRQNADVAILIVEDEVEEDALDGLTIVQGRLRKIKYQSVVRLLFDLQRKDHHIILHTPHMRGTVSTLVALHESFRRTPWQHAAPVEAGQLPSYIPAGPLPSLVPGAKPSA